MYARPSKILIIDDDVELVTLLVDYFTLEGFEATPAHSGTEGLQALESKEFDLIILDVMMPGISGVETLQRIREKWRTPVLMLTARGDPVDRILGLELGADDYVPKPCSPRELVAASAPFCVAWPATKTTADRYKSANCRSTWLSAAHTMTASRFRSRARNCPFSKCLHARPASRFRRLKSIRAFWAAPWAATIAPSTYTSVPSGTSSLRKALKASP